MLSLGLLFSHFKLRLFQISDLLFINSRLLSHKLSIVALVLLDVSVSRILSLFKLPQVLDTRLKLLLVQGFVLFGSLKSK